MAHSWPVRSVLIGLTLALFASSLVRSVYVDREQATEIKAGLVQAEVRRVR